MEEGRLNPGNCWVGLTVPPRALFFQTLDINWTGMTNLLDIPGLRYQGLTEHLLSAAAWLGVTSSKRCSGALQEPGAAREIGQVPLKSTKLWFSSCGNRHFGRE